ncbi:TonB-dependent siderophore receptor [Actomonas aquatica]|uniref:TonB-dependent receptor plug domain-containing protein n=1 Tax=Actomonas aquatica TaxID=2866162 RepID=A0ABZ1C465_9BACT|nr:TonB-dependent receptor plug domain-containing protein [Opitutus sp. WL0086]WRQ86395.1 TonB-dependent receptor plug domain-containing protein [Opitutus sp. WL0086]
MNPICSSPFTPAGRLKVRALTVLGLSCWSLGVLAQGVDNPTPDAPEDENLVVLNPFTVSADRDVGYLANSTLAGSRTNTEIKDLANPLDIFTPELISDLGVQDIQDLTALANGVEPNGAGGYNTEGQEVSIWNYNYMQIRGFKTGIATRNFMDLNSTYEAYNSDRVEFSKGPNSILFGAGNPGGSSNYATKVPMLARSAYEVQHRTDDLGSQRLSTDLNQVLIPGTLALRFNSLWEDRDFYREPAYEKDRGMHLTARWQPTASTTITLGYEDRVTHRASPRGAFSNDYVTRWLNAGAPLVTAVPANNQVVLEGSSDRQSASTAGVTTTNSDRWVMVDGVIRNMRRTAVGDDIFTNDNRMDTVATGLDYPEKYWSGGPNGINDNDQQITELNITQRVTDDFYLDFSFGHSDSINRTGQSVSRDIYVDPNDFGDNTHPGEWYIESRPFWIDRGIEITDARLTASYELDLTGISKWFGRHQIAAMYEHSERDEWWDNGRLTLTATPDGPVTGNLRAGRLAFYLREYLDPANGKYAASDYRDLYYSDGFSQDGYTASFLRRESWAAYHTLDELDTLLGVVQSRWWDDRIVTTIGLRRDYRDFTTAPMATDSVTQLPYAVEIVPGAPAGATSTKYAAFLDPAEETNGISRNFGAVVHVTDWLSLTGNYATNFSPRATSRDLYGDYVEASSGESTDIGVRLNLFEDKVNVSLLHFKTSELNSITNGDSINTPIKLMSIIEDLLVDNGVVNTNILALNGNHTTSDRTGEGEELMIIGNPTPQWSFRLSASRLINEQRNVGPDIRAFYDERMPFYRAQDQSLTPADRNKTLAEYLTEVDEQYALLQTREKVKVFPSSEYNVRLTGKYTFDRDSVLKGLSIGGTGKWTSAPVIGYYKMANGAFDVNRYDEGEDLFTADLFLAYQRKFGRDLRWKVQLNVSNLFDNTDPIAVSSINDVDAADFEWVVYRHRPVFGRVFSLTNTISF